MLVNTRFFNYRLTIGTLIVAILAIAAYGFSGYKDIRSDSKYLVQEKKLLQQELGEFIELYEELGSENQSLKSQFNSLSSRARVAFDSLSQLNANLSVLSQLKAELMFLKRQNVILKSDSLTRALDAIEKEKAVMQKRLNRTARLNAALERENAELAEALSEGARLSANSFRTKVFRQKGTKELLETQRAKFANLFEVCFVIAENRLTEQGKRTLFIQILGPDNNVINDKGAVEFGNLSLIYSSDIEVNYTNRAEEICTLIPNIESFKKGVYHVSVFEDEQILGKTQIELN